MRKNIPLLIGAIMLSPVALAESDINGLIDGKDYKTLKQHLYLEQPDVLDRSTGMSPLDYAISKRDKRAAIIIADYNNSTISQRRLRAVELELQSLNQQIEKSGSNNSKLTAMIAELEEEKSKLHIDVTNEAIKDSEDKLLSIEERVARLEAMAMPPEIKKATLKSREFLNEGIVISEKDNNE